MREFAAALRLSREKGVGAATFRRLVEEYITPSLALEAWNNKLKKQHCLSLVSQNKTETVDLIAQTLKKIEMGMFYGWYYSQSGYPDRLKDLGEPPPVIFASAPFFDKPMVAVVGARKMTPEAACMAAEIVKYFVGKGYAILSGGAAGVDAVAHETALAENALTAAVLGTGIDVVYPECNRELLNKIRTSGILATELMPGAAPVKSFFPTRNRIIAALAEIVVVVQASDKSGSMITAAWASRLGRRIVTIVPPTDDLQKWAGNQMLIRSGAEIFKLP